MPIRIKFDTANQPEKPTFIIAYKNGKKMGAIETENLITRDLMNAPAEISFKTKKCLNENKNLYWDKVSDFRLLWCKDYDLWYELYVDTNESTEIVKTVTAKQLGQAELGQIKLYTVEINTEKDITRDDYEIPTVLYREDNHKASLLHRVLEKAPHYRIRHVDRTIQNIQRTFSFNNISIPDALNQIAMEIGCLVVYHSGTDIYGNIEREISLYDLQSNCMNPACHYRGEFIDVCPECGSTNIQYGYGEDTTIFVTADELADNLNFVVNRDAVKNCFKLGAGDELMTATIRNCNPNGSDYIWYLSDDMKKDMSDELREKIDQYNELYNMYLNDYDINPSLYNQYSELISKYSIYPTIEMLDMPSKGFSSLMKAVYHTIDMELFLRSGLMPIVEVSDTNAQIEALNLNENNMSPVSVADISKISLATANNAVLSMAKVIVDTRYQVKIENSNLSDHVWTGNFIVKNYSDEEDVYTTGNISIQIDDDYESFIEQKLNKLLSDEEPDDYSVTGVFKLNYHSFCDEIKKYGLNILTSLRDMAQTCINFLIEQGVSNNESWGDNLYERLYLPRYDQLVAIENELLIRQNELDLVIGKYDENQQLIQAGFQTQLLSIRQSIQSDLDFEKYLGKELWLEFCTYRREDLFQNQNYISTGLNNAELVQKANEFIEMAKKEIVKSAEKQHSITATLKNLLFIPRFKKLTDMFSTGNWIRVRIDGKVYRLRLLSYEINFDNTSVLNVEFSDVIKTADGITDQQKIFASMISMTTSYNAVQKQAEQGAEGTSQINNWMSNGLDATYTKIVNKAKNQTQEWGSSGMLFREYDPITETYDDDQLKIINSTLVFTNDQWKTAKTAVGKFHYIHPKTNQLETVYGINGEALVGKVILGENLGIYSNNGRLTFDDNGFVVSNNKNTVSINPNDPSSIIYVSNHFNEKILDFDDDGNLIIVGKIRVKSIEFEEGIKIKTDDIDTLHSVAMTGNYKELSNLPEFSDVAYSGKYDDLSGRPTIQTSISSNNTTDPVSGSAVYDFAIAAGKNGYANNRILGTNASGQVIWMTTAEVRAMLGLA